MSRLIALSCALAVVLATLFAMAPAGLPAPHRAPHITGFTRDHARQQTALEREFKSQISPQRAREFHRYFTAEPHPAGSKRNNELAQSIARTWKEQGLEDVVVHRYDVLNSYPKQVVVEMVSPMAYSAGLREAPYAVDPDTRNPRIHGAYFGLSASGEITAPVVYAHSGNPEDYELLGRRHIDVRGKIALVRYSNPYSYRGFKALTAQNQGAAALLIYSDPAEDGYQQGRVFPHGPWGPETHIQRGAITYDFIVPGDPLTPGWASVEGARRILLEEARSVPKIIAVPLSWHDARPLLENMGGPPAPPSWKGGLPITYRLGGEGRVHVKVAMDTRPMPNYVVEARLRGSAWPDEWVVMGNHRDAWEFGGVDPSSGTASMMEMTRVLGAMRRHGVRPRCTLVICSWDGEELGLTGSTEWGEQYADDLRKKVVAYLNVDSSVAGPEFQPNAVASLAPMLIEAAHSLDDPSGRTLYEAWKASAGQDRRKAHAKEPVTDANLVETRVGSGSDHTVFLNFLGRPTMELHFEGPYGVYHSAYDDYFWMNQFGDPGYRYHALCAQLWGVLGLRLANADILPLDFAVYAQNIRRFLQALAAATPQLESHLDLTSLRQAVREFEAEGRMMARAVDQHLEANDSEPALAQVLNTAEMQVEANWLNPAGIPGRPWFKHLIYGTRYTYAHLELPGLTEAAEKGDWQTAREQAQLIERALRRNAALLREARVR